MKKTTKKTINAEFDNKIMHQKPEFWNSWEELEEIFNKAFTNTGSPLFFVFEIKDFFKDLFYTFNDLL